MKNCYKELTSCPLRKRNNENFSVLLKKMPSPLYKTRPAYTLISKHSPSLDESSNSLETEAHSEARRRTLSYNSQCYCIFPFKIRRFLSCHIAQKRAATAEFQRILAFFPLPKANEFFVTIESQQPGMTHKMLASLDNLLHNLGATKQ